MNANTADSPRANATTANAMMKHSRAIGAIVPYRLVVVPVPMPMPTVAVASRIVIAVRIVIAILICCAASRGTVGIAIRVSGRGTRMLDPVTNQRRTTDNCACLQDRSSNASDITRGDRMIGGRLDFFFSLAGDIP